MAKDLKLSKESSELLTSMLKKKNLLKPGTLITSYQNVMKNSCHISPKKMKLCTVTTLKVFLKSSESLNIILTIGDFALIAVKEV